MAKQPERQGLNAMTRELTAFRSIAPIRHSTYHRISRAILLLPITILLSGCPPWSISKIVVNPQPLPGNETVFPVVLVAPTSQGPSSTQHVALTVEFLRDKNFTDPIEFYVRLSYQDKQLQTDFFPVVSSTGRGVIFQCLCSLEQHHSPPTGVVLEIRPAGLSTFYQITVEDRTQAKAALEIEVNSRIAGGDELTEEWVTSYAAKALEISCLRNSPNQLVAVPRVIGLTAAAAIGSLQSVGFLAHETDTVDDTCKNIGVVSGQSPSAGTAAIQGSTVTILVGKRPPHPCP